MDLYLETHSYRNYNFNKISYFESINILNMKIIRINLIVKTLMILLGIECYGQTLKIDNEGTATFDPNGTDYDIIIKGDYLGSSDEPVIMPSQDNWGYIGTSTHEFYRIYAKKIYTSGVEVTSDERKKENIKPLGRCLEKIQKVKGLEYNFNPGTIVISAGKDDSKDSEKKKLLASQKEFGFSAQELGKVFPELVHRDSQNDTYTVNYIGMIPVLLEAINEQQKTIETLTKRINKLEND